MKEKKNIDQFFKNRFDNHEVNPPEEIWGNIEEKLQKRKKRRVIPFWWYSSGVAALFVIGMFVFNRYYTLEIHPINDVVIENAIPNETNNDNSIVNEDKDQNNVNNAIKDSVKKTSFDQNYVNKEKNNSSVVSNEINSNEKEEKINSKNIKNTVFNKTKNVSKDFESNSTIVATQNNSEENSKIKRQQIINQPIADVDNENKTVENVNNKVSATNKNISQQTNVDKTVTEIENKNIEKQKNTVQKNSDVIKINSELNTENNIDLGKIAMKNNDNVAKKGEVNTSKDSTAIATVEPNELEELLKEKETQISQEQKMNRWQVTPNLAPIYFGSFDSGSPLDSNLDENTKSFNNSISYGVAVNYTLNSKLRIRTGINSFSIDYNTNDIVFFQSGNARMMKNIDPTIEGSFIEIIPIKNLNTSFNRLETEQNTGVLNQRMGYIEMPMEISYRLMDKKFSIDLLGGMSTLFLNKNEVFLETDEMSLKVGEATNINPLHFSTNFGVGLNYGFTKSFQARVEPTFKYQLNTFSRDSQNFKPYIFGIYTGISINF